ncbi:MAG TPA: vanadium-dependent haloperoxidase [Candidatus Limnocylindrales bacterium]|jgi:hypothetical protein
MALPLAAVLTVAAMGLAGPVSAAPAANPAVINQWSAVAVATVTVDAGKANAEGFMWLGFTQAAVYNAVNGITGRYELYRWNPTRPAGASPQAAAAAAAYTILVNYFPTSKVSRLDPAYAASLAAIPNGQAKARGIRFGQRAAARIIALRTNDGRNAPITFDRPLGPGVWRPTATPPVPFFDPWLSQLRPLTLRSPDQFRPGPYPALGSARYARDFNEVKLLGSATSTARTPAQTQTALFVSGMTFSLVGGALGDYANRHGLGISARARLFAAVDMSVTDAVIASWDSKMHFGFWRPVTAIRLADTDGNDATAPDTGWNSLIPSPPYPDYTSGLNSVAAAATRAMTRVVGSSHVDLNVFSGATGTTRHYELASQVTTDAVNARVWSGIHFRFADDAGRTQGHRVADWALDHYFQPR